MAYQLLLRVPLARSGSNAASAGSSMAGALLGSIARMGVAGCCLIGLSSIASAQPAATAPAKAAATATAPADDTTPKAAPKPAPKAPSGPVVYKQLKFHPALHPDNPANKRTLSDAELRIKKLLLGSSSFEQEQRTLGTWLAQHLFPKMTQVDRATNLPKNDVAGIRQELLTQYLGRVKEKDAHDYIRNLVLSQLTPIVQNHEDGNYHPVARYNAMLLIGDLNATEASRSGDKAPPKPDLRGLKVALDEFNDPKQIDAVRVAALLSMLRHAKLNGQTPRAQRMSPVASNAIINAVFPLLDAEPPAGRSIEGHAWMQMRAIETLGYLREVGEGNKIADRIALIINDRELPLEFRFAALEAYSRLEFPGSAKPNYAQVAFDAGDMLLQAANEEIANLQAEVARRVQEQRELSGVSGESGGYEEGLCSTCYGIECVSDVFGCVELCSGASGEGVTQVDPAIFRVRYRITAMRRRLYARATYVEDVLNNRQNPIYPGILKQVSDQAERDYINSVASAASRLTKKLNDPERPLQELITDLESQVIEYQTALKKAPDTVKQRAAAVIEPPADASEGETADPVELDPDLFGPEGDGGFGPAP